MKPNEQRKRNIAQVPGGNLRTRKVQKIKNRTNGSAQKASGVPPFIGAKNEIDPLSKIKLQLFPVDEVTRIGLEKDGLNPFLELKLSARKKLSSVIKHIHTKWGGSRIASKGEPMLLPYGANPAMPMTRIWTSNDTVITAGDVYTTVQSPIFRLSYGWFSFSELQRASAATGLHNHINSESIPKPFDTTEERKCLDATEEAAVTSHADTEVKTSQSHEYSISPRDDELTNLTMGGLVSDASVMRKISNSEFVLNGRNTSPWDDSLTALSIGGLLSEVSLQAKINHNNSNNNNNNKFDTRSNGTFISDSFDAIISSQVAKQPSIDTRSILDAEETCHAFAFRKFSSSNKNVRVCARVTQDSSSNSFKFPHFLEVNKQAILADNNLCLEPKMELFSRSQPFGEDSTSLGLRSITWNESLGPFDLGNSMSWKFFGGGNV